MDQIQTIVTESLMGMIAAVTGTTPPANEPPPQFVQAAIDRAAARIRAEVVPIAIERATAAIETKLFTDDIPDFHGSGNKARRRAEALGIKIERPGPFRHPAPEGIDSEGGSCD